MQGGAGPVFLIVTQFRSVSGALYSDDLSSQEGDGWPGCEGTCREAHVECSGSWRLEGLLSLQDARVVPVALLSARLACRGATTDRREGKLGWCSCFLNSASILLSPSPGFPLACSCPSLGFLVVEKLKSLRS